MSFTPIPGQRVEGYDLSARLDTDFYAVFRDIPDADRDAWDRAKTFADEVDPGDRRLLGPRRVQPRLRPPHGRARPVHRRHRARRHHAPLAARRRPREHGDLARRRLDGHDPRGAGRPRAAHARAVRQRRAEGAVPRARSRAARCSRPSRSPSPTTARTRSRSRPRRGCDGGEWVLNGAKKWIGNGASGGITFVWARVPTDDGRGTVRCFLVPQDTPGYDGAADPRQGVAARHPPGPHHAHRCAAAGRRGAAGSEELQGCLDRALRDALRRRVVGARARDRVLRVGAHLCARSACSSASRSSGSRWCRSASPRCSTS